MSAPYRVRQFVLAAASVVRGEKRPDPVVDRLLTPCGVELFRAMPRYDRRHALGVARTLAAQGQDDPDLLAAALLHDAGKTCSDAGRLLLWHRVLMVLVRALMPGLIDRRARKGGGHLRQAFFVQKYHAQLGAELALAAGCTRETAELIACHETDPVPAGDPRVAALRAADSAN